MPDVETHLGPSFIRVHCIHYCICISLYIYIIQQFPPAHARRAKTLHVSLLRLPEPPKNTRPCRTGPSRRHRSGPRSGQGHPHPAASVGRLALMADRARPTPTRGKWWLGAPSFWTHPHIGKLMNIDGEQSILIIGDINVWGCVRSGCCTIGKKCTTQPFLTHALCCVPPAAAPRSRESWDAPPPPFGAPPREPPPCGGLGCLWCSHLCLDGPCIETKTSELGVQRLWMLFSWQNKKGGTGHIVD